MNTQKRKSHREQRGNARVKTPQRDQVEMHFYSLNELIREDHLARTVMQYVDSLDLTELYRPIRATTGSVGRNSIDPRILLTLWLFATLEGESSARRIATLATRDFAYMWICGGVSVNHHTLSDFRTEHADVLEKLLTDSITILQHHGLIELRSIAQDGMRVRANAGSGSFRTQGTLEESREHAEAYLRKLINRQSDNEDEDEDSPSTPAQASGRERAAIERAQRLEQACQEVEKMQEKWDKRNRTKSAKNQRSRPRASTTDPEARRMKMGDGGIRPAMNVQFASDADAMLIVSVDVTNEGSDSALLKPMYDEVCDRYAVIPDTYMADGGFSKKAGVTHVERCGTKFYGPLHRERQQLEEGGDPYAARANENENYTAYRARMGTDEAKEIYRRRAPAAEFPNAVCRNQKLRQFSVRGLKKTRAETLWHVLAYNFRRFLNLRDEKTDRNYLEVLMTS